METNIESHLVEKRVFKPAKDFAKKARVKSLAQYRKMYRESMQRPDTFWGEKRRNWCGESRGKKCSNGKRRSRNGSSAGNSTFRRTVSIVILTVHAETRLRSFGKANRATNGTLTYQQLHREVCQFANVLKRNKIRQRRSRHHLSCR